MEVSNVSPNGLLFRCTSFSPHGRRAEARSEGEAEIESASRRSGSESYASAPTTIVLLQYNSKTYSLSSVPILEKK